MMFFWHGSRSGGRDEQLSGVFSLFGGYIRGDAERVALYHVY